MNLLTPAIPKCDLIIANNWDSILPAWQSKQGKPVHFPQHYDEVFFSLDATPEIGFQGNPMKAHHRFRVLPWVQYSDFEL
jgi:hypothetical protein